LAKLAGIIDGLSKLPVKLIFPAHPRTKRIAAKNIEYREPLPYDEFIELMAGAAFVITDSGGVQEESTYLGVPCFTVRPSTERPVTVLQGTNRLVTDFTSLNFEVTNLLSMPKLWDGRASERIAQILNRTKEAEKAASA
jgi:UDP-N-acetylglucosamine 2-epimerase (non-hydrolysing)